MTFELFRWAFPGIAASQIGAGEAVSLTASALERNVIPVSTCNVEPFAIALASAGGTYLGSGSGGFALTTAVPLVDQGNTIKVTAAGSCGVGADIGVASTNGGLAPVAAASGVDVWAVGKSVTAAGAGEVFALYIRPRKLSGTVR